jgi:hypothetical protein
MTATMAAIIASIARPAICDRLGGSAARRSAHAAANAITAAATSAGTTPTIASP